MEVWRCAAMWFCDVWWKMKTREIWAWKVELDHNENWYVPRLWMLAKYSVAIVPHVRPKVSHPNWDSVAWFSPRLQGGHWHRMLSQIWKLYSNWYVCLVLSTFVPSDQGKTLSCCLLPCNSAFSGKTQLLPRRKFGNHVNTGIFLVLFWN